MRRPPESLKSFADRIAQAAAPEEANQLIRMLRVSGLMGGFADQGIANYGRDEAPSTFSVSEPGVPPKQSRLIGIWEHRIENGKTCFVRQFEAMHTWHFWANVGRIEAKGSKLRVLFIGESVARGYLYDPSFNPALALQMILEKQFGKDQIEIIDLARTNLSYELKNLSLAALQLEPDIAIIFAGNNWEKKTTLPTFSDIAEMDEAIRTGGMVEVKRFFDQYIERRARKMVSEIVSEYKNNGIPLIWIIPEFNLADWREPFTNAPYLPDNRNREWIAVFKEARKAFSDGDFVRAEQLAARVVEIDQGVCAAGYYILADCRRLANDHEGQRKYLELARDAQTWDNSIMYIPKNYAMAQQVLREELPKHNAQVVDLPALFKQYLNGGVPGTRLFIDYCHLTSEGMRIAMGAAASHVLRTLKGVEQPWYTVVDDHVAPSPEIEAEASFLAAIHDAHRYQSYEMVHHFCARALKHSLHIGDIMLNYIDLQVFNKAPLRMSEAELQIFRVGSPLVHHYLFHNNDKRLDKLLLTAMADALEEAGIPARERLALRYREEHSTRVGETNLLHPFYYHSAGQPHELEAIWWLDRVKYDPRYFRAYWPDSKFVFVGEAGYPINLSLTCRLPKLSLEQGKISIECNGKPQVEISVSKEWSSWEITVPGEVIRDGINEIEVHWPVPAEFRTDDALNEVILKLCQMKYPEYYPLFGEIHVFTASSVAEAVEGPYESMEVAVAQAVV